MLNRYSSSSLGSSQNTVGYFCRIISWKRMGRIKTEHYK
uniref:Uncharacterized protein n=1 Tax=Podoviridae sp. ct8Lf7 TaxID=2827723 RepID=A0A8S5S151_9CAUD|nr:MAG TPA: hypothetical protein [Podoviridae sp. ct8Lf7]